MTSVSLARPVPRPPARSAGWLVGAAGAVVSLALPYVLDPGPVVRLVVAVLVAVQWRLLVGLLVWTARVVRWAVVGAWGAAPRPARARRLPAVVCVAALAAAPLVAGGASDVLVGRAGPSAPATQFLGGVTSPLRIAQATGAPAMVPVRAYASLGDGGSDAARAAVAVDRLRRAGGFARSTVLVVAPTGSGWVDPAAVATMEYLTGGDVATVAAQYADRPSWVEYLQGTGPAERSAAALVGAVRAAVDAMPDGQRPRLVLYGESLGAVAAAGAAGQADATLLAGLPAGAGRPAPPRTTTLLNADDPVGHWSPGLLVAPQGPGPWLPLVSFWQVTGSLPGALDVPAGHGHRYGGALAQGFVDAGAVPGPDAMTVAAVSRAIDG